MIYFLVSLLWLLLGLYVSHHCLVVPLLDTEHDLRKELKEVRADLYRAKHGRICEEWAGTLKDVRAFVNVFNAKTPKIPHRSHSKVRFISHPGDLLK